jgi:hypothetical protein
MAWRSGRFGAALAASAARAQQLGSAARGRARVLRARGYASCNLASAWA